MYLQNFADISMLPSPSLSTSEEMCQVSLHQLPRGALAHCVLEKKNVCVILFEYSKGMTALQLTGLGVEDKKIAPVFCGSTVSVAIVAATVRLLAQPNET